MNTMARILVLAQVILPVAALPTAALAQTVYVVDDNGGPGVAFTEIQPAVDIAGPFDRIDVRDGTYGNVTIQRPVTIMGLTADPALVRIGAVSIQSISGPGSVVLSKVRPASVAASNVDATLLLDRIDSGWVTCTNCTDCRLQHVDLEATGTLTPSGGAPLHVTDSFVQLAAGRVRGGMGPDVILGTGGPGIRLEGQSLLVITGGDVRGGAGGSSPFGLSNQRYGERGGPGIQIAGGPAELLLLDSNVGGGDAGSGTLGNDGPGSAFAGCNATTSIEVCRSATTGAPPSAACLASTTMTAGRPSIILLGGNTPGQPGSIDFRGRGGASARVIQGRNFDLAPSPNGPLPRLITVDRTSSVGPFSTGMPTTWNYTTSPFARGSRIHFQTVQPQAVAGIEWSNAMTILID